jgi:hypothetical protein
MTEKTARFTRTSDLGRAELSRYICWYATGFKDRYNLNQWLTTHYGSCRAHQLLFVDMCVRLRA